MGKEVWNPTAAGIIIGRVKVILGGNDVSLIELSDQFSFGERIVENTTNFSVSLIGFKKTAMMSG